MIQNSFILVFVLLGIEGLILYLEGHPRFKRFFRFLPAVFWIYFIPMLASTSGLIDSKNPIYKMITTHLLPASLFLLLITVDIKAILRLGRPALIMMLAGSLGIMLGTPIVFWIFQHWVGAETWSGFGALAASWMGGSANMIAVKEAIGTPDEIFLPMVIVDTIIPYCWMGILVGLLSLEAVFDRWNRADRTMVDELSRKISGLADSKKHHWRFGPVVLILCLAVLGSFVAQIVAGNLPVIKDILSTYAWTIIIVTFLGILLSFTPTRKLDNYGSSKIGQFMLYFVLTTIGAKANLSSIGSTLILIGAGFCMVLFHALVLLLAARIIRAPLFLVAVASQANLGGVASAPIIAEIYQPGLASVGLLLAIWGNICGTYLGILTAQLCRFIGSG